MVPCGSVGYGGVLPVVWVRSFLPSASKWAIVFLTAAMRKHPCVKSTIIHAEAPLCEIHHARPAAAQPVCGRGTQLHPVVRPSRLECLGVLEYPWVVLPVHPDVCAVDDDIPRPVLQARPIRAPTRLHAWAQLCCR